MTNGTDVAIPPSAAAGPGPGRRRLNEKQREDLRKLGEVGAAWRGDGDVKASPDINPALEKRVVQERAEATLREREVAESRASQLARETAEADRQAADSKENTNDVLRIEAEAERILQEGRPFEYFISTFALDHEGDLTAARCMAMVFASSAVSNGEGVHCYLSGSSGRGKTHAAETMFRQLPDDFRYNLGFSDKFLFYAGNDAKTGLKGGVVILIDDQTMSESVQEIFKVSVSHYREGTKYGTVVNQKAIVLNVPARLSWILLKVDDPGDDQVMNRVIQARIQETDEKIRDSAKKIQEKYQNLQKKNIQSDRREIRICRSMWQKIKDLRVAVEVPCAGHVIFADYENLRNHELFFNLIMAHAVIHRWQRRETGITEDNIPIILATEADYKEARLIFESLHSFGGQRHRTLQNEDLVIDALIGLNPENGIFTIRQVAAVAGLSHKVCGRALNGRESTGKVKGEMGGLLDKCPFIQKMGKRGKYELETETEIVNKKDRVVEITRKESFNEEIYQVNLDSLKAWRNNSIPVWLAPGFKWGGVST